MVEATEMKALNEINRLVAKDLAKKVTIRDLEQQAKDVLEHGDLTKETSDSMKDS